MFPLLVKKKLNGTKDPVPFPFRQNTERYTLFLDGNVTMMLADPKNLGGE